MFAEKAEETFPNRIWFLGLQGSYGRGEATENSDIDAVVIFDALRAEDLKAYRAMLDTLPHREKICGFVSGKAELLHWDAADLFQFYYDTTPIKGSLDALLETIDREAIDKSIHLGVCNIYHACAHNIIHERDGEILRSLCKSARFVIQAIYFRQSGEYCKQKAKLAKAVPAPERRILEIETELAENRNLDSERFDALSEEVLSWAQTWILQ